ncbi:MAG TPA: class I SAM-dependent methyltransferase [Pseudomonadales bacterium]
MRFVAAPFDALPERGLPSFDFVVAHGVYSWIGAHDRRVLRNLIAARLAPGGLAYLSYNCLPGWSLELPVRRLMHELAAVTAHAAKGPADAVDAVCTALEQLADAGLGYFHQHPALAAALDAYRRSPPGYLAHEFLGVDWAPSYSVDVADEMAEAGMVPIGSATLCDNHPPLLLGDRLAARIAALPSSRLRRLAVDFAVERRFRRDLFMHAADRSHAAAVDLDATVLLGRAAGAPKLPATVSVPRGRLTFAPDFVRSLEALLENGGASLAQLCDALAAEADLRPAVRRNLLYLTAAGALQPYARRSGRAEPGQPLRFPSVTVERMVATAAKSERYGWVASTLTGAGVRVDRAEAAALLRAVAARRADLPRGLHRLRRLGLVR